METIKLSKVRYDFKLAEADLGAVSAADLERFGAKIRQAIDHQITSAFLGAFPQTEPPPPPRSMCVVRLDVA